MESTWDNMTKSLDAFLYDKDCMVGVFGLESNIVPLKGLSSLTLPTTVRGGGLGQRAGVEVSHLPNEEVSRIHNKDIALIRLVQLCGTLGPP